MPSSAF
ncbi:hypothetical protein D043_2780A, partial [Vibrio parahaemolyticus EKP-021]